MSEAAVPLPAPAPPAGPPGGRAPRWQADTALVVAAFFFGTTFIVVQDAVAESDPLPFLAARFLIAGAVLAVLGRRRPASPREVRHGLVAGVALLAGYILQTVGLQYTTPATSAFITYLLVVFVPLLTFAFLRRRPHPLTLAGLVPAVVGLVLLTGGADASFGKGEALTLGCAVAFAAHLVIVGETAGRHDAIRFTCVQVTTVGVACLAASVVTADLSLSAGALGAAAFTGVFATALAFAAMVWAQRVVSPSRAALILLLEPVFAALLSGLTGDALTPSQLAGGALILAAVAIAEVLPPYLTARRAAVGHSTP
ncbi:MAG TPA: DMT family transporter [Acidimicrobiales bacterium]|nr:DMT family transporter [Acidimicrobiales bacterium]